MKWPWHRRAHARNEREQALQDTQSALAESTAKLEEAQTLHDKARVAKKNLDKILDENRFRLKMERAFRGF